MGSISDTKLKWANSTNSFDIYCQVLAVIPTKDNINKHISLLLLLLLSKAPKRVERPEYETSYSIE